MFAIYIIIGPLRPLALSLRAGILLQVERHAPFAIDNGHIPFLGSFVMAKAAH